MHRYAASANCCMGVMPPKPMLGCSWLYIQSQRVAFLFERYQALTSLLPADKPRKPRKRGG
jgi:hypothetical protein